MVIMFQTAESSTVIFFSILFGLGEEDVGRVLGEVENECTLHNFNIFAMPSFGQNLSKLVHI